MNTDSHRQGRPVAILLPLDVSQAEEEMVRAGREAILDDWARCERLAEELRDSWRTWLSIWSIIPGCVAPTRAMPPWSGSTAPR
jgi:hypothetical protein